MEQQNLPDIPETLINGPPWERRDELGFFLAFVETIRYLLWRPGQLFSVMHRGTGLGGALVFAVALQVFTTVWRFAIADAMGDPIPILPPEILDLVDAPEDLTRWVIMLFPLWLIAFHFLKAGAFHLALRLRGVEDRRFALMFRVLAYGAGGASILLLLPMVGGLLSLVYSVYLLYLGIRTVYGLAGGQFLGLAVIASLLLLGFFIAILIGLSLLEVLVLLIL